MRDLLEYAFFCVTLACIVLFFLLLALTSFCDISHAQGHLEPISVVSIEGYTVNQWVKAIYMAEGGDNATYKYGIRSIACSSAQACRKICFNTVKNNFKRWENSTHEIGDSFLHFISRRYAPEGVRNDPQGLNYNWERNVKYWLERG